MLEIGKTYKARCGAVVQVIAYDPANVNYPHVIEIVGTYTAYEVNTAGEYLSTSPGNQLDIVSREDGTPL